MIYDPRSPLDIKKAEARFGKLIKGERPFELREVKDRHLTEEHARTLRQNSTIHMWFTVLAEEIGCTMEECKRDVKRHILGRKPVYNVLTGETDWDDYKTSEMTTAELSSFMERFKAFADTDFGCYLPYYGDVGYEDMMRQYKQHKT